jgi:hypothetical protein
MHRSGKIVSFTQTTFMRSCIPEQSHGRYVYMGVFSDWPSTPFFQHQSGLGQVRFGDESDSKTNILIEKEGERYIY